MNKKLLALFAEYIRDHVAYSENREVAADMVLTIAKKTRKRLTQKEINDFNKIALK